MMEAIRTIAMSLPFRLGAVNCYLIKTDTGYILIDTGSANQRARLESELTIADCQPGYLRLIVLTHGDFDHTGNATYLRGKLGARIAMHRDDAGMAERGDMFWNRSSGNPLLRLMAPVLFRFSKASRFKPDVFVKDGDDLSEYGLEAQVISIPGHSKGSIGILTAGDPSTGSGPALFCGDLLENVKRPTTNSIMDAPAACAASLARLQALEIDTVYPGHGQPFSMASFLASYLVAGEKK